MLFSTPWLKIDFDDWVCGDCGEEWVCNDFIYEHFEIKSEPIRVWISDKSLGKDSISVWIKQDKSYDEICWGYEKNKIWHGIMGIMQDELKDRFGSLEKPKKIWLEVEVE